MYNSYVQNTLVTKDLILHLRFKKIAHCLSIYRYKLLQLVQITRETAKRKLLHIA